MFLDLIGQNLALNQSAIRSSAKYLYETGPKTTNFMLLKLSHIAKIANQSFFQIKVQHGILQYTCKIEHHLVSQVPLLRSTRLNPTHVLNDD